MSARPTRDQAVTHAGAWLADRLDHIDHRSPREIADEVAAGHVSVNADDVEDRVRALRGLPPLDRSRRAA